MVFFLSKEQKGFRSTKNSYMDWESKELDGLTVFVCKKKVLVEVDKKFGEDKNKLMLKHFLEIGNQLSKVCDYIHLDYTKTYHVDGDDITNWAQDSDVYIFQREKAKLRLERLILSFIREYGYYESDFTIDQYRPLKDALIFYLDSDFKYKLQRNENMGMGVNDFNCGAYDFLLSPKYDVIPAWHILQSFYTLFLKYTNPRKYFEEIELYPEVSDNIFMSELKLDVTLDGETNKFKVSYQANGTIEVLEYLLLETHSDTPSTRLVNCRECGLTFIAINIRQIFCSDSCKSRYNVREFRKRNKLEGES